MTGLQPGATIELPITGLNHLGQGLGRWNNLVIFVAGALPGELAQVRIKKIHASHAQGELLSLLETSPQRVEPLCPLYGNCGGCHLQHSNYQGQLAFKQQLLTDNLQRLGRLDIEVLPIIPAWQPFFYRNRTRLHYDSGQLGFYAANSHQIIPAKNCPLLLPALNDLLASIWKIFPIFEHQLASSRLYSGEMSTKNERSSFNSKLKTQNSKPGLQGSPLRSIAFKSNHDSSQLALILTSDHPLSNLDGLFSQLSQDNPALASVWLNWGRASGGNFGAKWQLAWGQPTIEEQLGPIRLAVGPASFLQTNWPQANKLYNLALEALELKENETLIDLYSGIGSIALLAADKAAKVAGIEEYSPAVTDAKNNAGLNKITNTDFYAGKVEEVLPHLQASGWQPQSLVLNPPRSGCSGKALTAIGELKAQKIAYISCNPATLARDLRQLVEMGYQPQWARPLDMFPQVAHVETVVLLSKLKSTLLRKPQTCRWR